MSMEQHDLAELKRARARLESPGLVARLSSKFGEPIEKALRSLPVNAGEHIESLAKVALSKSVDTALRTLDDEPGKKASRGLHKAGVAISGGVGGFFGAPAMAIELPLSTTLMMRSIADIARSYGENLEDPETRLSCLEVFAFGGTDDSDDFADKGYFGARAAMSYAIGEAIEHIARNGLLTASSPPLARLIATIASRFGVQLTQKFAVQSVPAIGAIGGATVNTLFMQHYQEMAEGHFAVRRLERKYGEDVVREFYYLVDDMEFEDEPVGQLIDSEALVDTMAAMLTADEATKAQIEQAIRNPGAQLKD